MPIVDVDEVHRFWFGAPGENRAGAWFASDPAFDHECRVRFADTLQALGRGDLNDWLDTPRGMVAWVILADQISRNVHRGSADAFARDHLSRLVTKHAIAHGRDRELGPFERAFLYMPLEHSEHLEDQDESVRLFTALVDAFPPEHVDQARRFVEFAEQHRNIIRRFARFPHRNAALGRTSTPEETAFLEAGATRFGQ